MRKLILNLFLGLFLLIASQACGPQSTTTSDPNFINTAIAGTMAAALTQTSQPGNFIPSSESPTPGDGHGPSPTPIPSSASVPSLTPIPNFAASYSGLESCKGRGWWVNIRLQNFGGMVFQSISMTVKNISTNSAVFLDSDDFTNKVGCIESSTQDILPPGITLLVSSPVFGYKPTGRTLRATITLCSGRGESGLCLTQAIDFIP